MLPVMVTRRSVRLAPAPPLPLEYGTRMPPPEPTMPVSFELSAAPVLTPPVTVRSASSTTGLNFEVALIVSTGPPPSITVAPSPAPRIRMLLVMVTPPL